MFPKEKKHKIEQACIKFINELDIKSVVATISGGADSVALVAALSRTNVKIIAAHCNFHLRGEESMRDMRHAENICRQLSIDLLVKDFDVIDYMQANQGISVEMACRDLRHRWFRQIIADTGFDRIATGHNADDNIETLFLNLLRGSGTSGLKGMMPDSGLIIRPLLQFHRKEISNYLETRGLDYVTDSTNLESDFRRNYLRNEIIPLLRSKWAGFDKAVDKSIKCIRMENAIVNDAIEKALKDNNHSLDVSRVKDFPDPELLVRRFIDPLLPFATTSSEVLAAIKANKPDIRIWKLRKGTLVMKNGVLKLKFSNLN
ncbi:MAG: tRNA lysidine(34) synthetase TilS [Muribaculaceae bacterium]|jgi:tRNA(Ile)-lysidine synthase